MEATIVFLLVLLLAALTVWFCVTYVAWREQKQMAFIQGVLAGFAACMVLNAVKHDTKGRPNHLADMFSMFMEQVPGVRKVARSHSPSSQ